MPPMEQAVRDNVRVEQMRMLFETPLPGMLLATVFACALAAQMRGSVPDAVLAGWVVAKCLVVLPRVVHALLNAPLLWLGKLYRDQGNQAAAREQWLPVDDQRHWPPGRHPRQGHGLFVAHRDHH